MRNLDFSSWQGLLSTLLGLAVITLIGVGIRLLVMQTVQQRRERENRQINERLRTLIAAYKTLGGSFTGDLAVDPTHLRDLRRKTELDGTSAPEIVAAESELGSSDRSRRIRDSVEAALSDIILLGTEEQVRLAAAAATELAAGRAVHTDALVVSLRDFIRGVLDLDPMPADVSIPRQGPARPGSRYRVERPPGPFRRPCRRQPPRGSSSRSLGSDLCQEQRHAISDQRSDRNAALGTQL
jgi:heme exporter protein D